MKFTTSFVALIAASVIALSSAKAAKESDIPRERFYQKLTDECREEVTKSELFKKCLFIDVDMNTIKETCKGLFSDDCKNFYSDGLKYLPKCTNDPLMKQVLESNKETAILNNEYYCTITSDGKSCPSIVNIIEGDADPSKFNPEGYKLDCEYQTCIDKQLKYKQAERKYSKLTYEMFNEGEYNQASQDEYYDGLIKFLQSPECAAQTKNKDEGKIMSSGATSVKALGTLLSLVLLYVMF